MVFLQKLHVFKDTDTYNQLILVFFQNEEIFVQLDELGILDKITHA